jgi:hypothetical protein
MRAWAVIRGAYLGADEKEATVLERSSEPVRGAGTID